MTDPELCYLSATSALELFKTHELSPVEYMQAQITRAEEIEPVVNAFAFQYFEEALVKAKKSEQRYMKKHARLGALEGLPLAVKDEMDIKGQPMTNGSLYLKNNVSKDTHYSVERLLRAGAIVHGRTTTPEFSCAPVAHSRVHGVTCTPWSSKFTCGGSSGGSAAALAAPPAALSVCP